MLKPDTERVWSFLRDQPALSGFVLVGGSALALRLGHRLSEDLDLAFPADRLPRPRLEALLRAAADAGWDVRPQDNPVAVREFEEGGLDLRDFQQDYVAAEHVRLTFFAPEKPFLSVFDSFAPTAAVRLATLDELFKMKSLLTVRRGKTRDWFDLYVLMTQQGYTLTAFHAAFAAAGMADQAAVGLQRLCTGQPALSDEGFAQMAPSAPSLEEMQGFFRASRDTYERSEATRSWRER